MGTDERNRTTSQQEGEAMFFTNRTWSKPKDVTELTPEAFAKLLTEYSWTSCSAWIRGNVAYLNDSASEDGAFEVAIVDVSESSATEITGRQIESITFGWIDAERAADYIRQLDNGTLHADMGIVTAPLHPAEGRCHSCA